MRLPSWTWAYVSFRFADGVSNALIPLVPLLVHDAPLWSVPAVAAVMNLVSVPSSFLWGGLMEKHRGQGRRRLAMLGFAASGIAMAVMAIPGPVWLFVVAAATFTGFGVATAPAASVLLLESVPGNQWAAATGRMARRTGIAYLVGVVLAVTAGLTGWLQPWWVFLVSAVAAIVAAFIARATIEPAVGPTMPRHPAGFGLDAVRNAQRRFERPVWFPSRLRHRPTLKGITLADGDPLKFLVGYFLLFTGSAVFFSSYGGVLSDRIGLAVGFVLLAQAPSNFVTPLVYPWAGRYGSTHGEMLGTLRGVESRIVIIPLMAVLLLFWQGWSYVPLLILHGAIGVSFALLQVNGSCMMAKCHRAGRGQGVGNFHAAVGLGSLSGSLLATLLFAVANLLVAYVVMAIMLLAGAAVVWSIRNSDQFHPRNH